MRCGSSIRDIAGGPIRCFAVAVAVAVAAASASSCGWPDSLEAPASAPKTTPIGKSPAAAAAEDLAVLGSGGPRREALKADDSHKYTLALEAGEFLEVQVRQVKGDVALDLSGPLGLTFPRVDAESRAARTEALFLVAEASGVYQLSVKAFAPGAEYEIRAEPIRASTKKDHARAQANWAMCEARSLRKTDSTEAAEKLREAVRGWVRVGDEVRRARALYELGEVLSRSSDHRQERTDAYEQARVVFEHVGETRLEASCLHRLGGIASEMDEIEPSRELFATSLVKWKAVGDMHEVSVVAYDQANMERRLGRPEAARRLFLEALEVAAHHSRPLLHEARIRTELGALYFYRGGEARGIREYRAALRILGGHHQPEERRIKKQRATTLNRLGAALPARADATTEDLEEAGALLQEARRLHEELEDSPRVALTANNLGLLYEKMNRPQLALKAFQQAEEVFFAQKSAADLAVVHGNRCRIVERLGMPEPALDCYLTALAGLQEAGFRSAEAHCLVDLAKNARSRGELHEAWSWIGSALEVVELIRQDSQSIDLRTSLLDRKYTIYELAVDIAFDLHQRDPAGGHADAAFRELESARARGFLETLARYRPELDLPPKLRDLRSKIHRVKVESLVAKANGADDLDRLERELSELVERLYLERPRFAFIEPEILSVAEVQRLLDPDTLLLVYHLGERRSAVWAVTDSLVRWHSLPPRSAIEKTALDLHEAMSSGAHRVKMWRYDHVSRELSSMILKPVADLLDRQRLVVVPAGALRYVPFASLPNPRSPAGITPSSTTGERADPGLRELLLHSHKITSTPSASVLAALRKRSVDRTPARGLLAMVAAPVFQEDDERLEGRVQATNGNTPRVTELTTPLPYTEIEAAAILELFEGADVHAALGLAANRDFVFSRALEDVKIVHFATHGHLDDIHSELSGLVLSQFDHSGRAIDGYVWAYELYDLDLRADLVVLSACETALGPAVRGEGLVGLTRGFLYAGAQQVLVSLWRVNDEATAALMKQFYRGLVHDALDPAEALRQAQIEIWNEGWTEPYYWAPFVLQGD